MKKEIHPTYYPDAVVSCACGNTWKTGSTLKEIRVDICAACHPFYTGEARIVDTEGQVDRFYKRLEARQKYTEDLDAREAARTSPERQLVEFELGKRPTEALAKAGITTVGQFMVKLAEGDQAVLNIEGFGRKSLADLKKAMRRMGYELPEESSGEAAEVEAV
jgi:large subunit ribosomal protein L31